MLERRGSTLAEMVVAIGMLGGLLLVLAVLACSTTRSGRYQRQQYEASALAQDLLDSRMAQSVEDLTPGLQPPIPGKLSDDTPYTALIEVYAVAGAGPATGLTDADLKRLKVVVQWRQVKGPCSVSADTYLAKIPR